MQYIVEKPYKMGVDAKHLFNSIKVASLVLLPASKVNHYFQYIKSFYNWTESLYKFSIIIVPIMLTTNLNHVILIQ